MKASIHHVVLVALAVAVSRIAGAQENSAGVNSSATTATSLPANSAIPRLAPGVADVAKLAQAKVGDSIILAFIQNSGTVYNLDANQIVYLHDIGVSEQVVSAMLSQRQKYLESAAQTAPGSPAPTASPAPTYGTAGAAPPEPAYVQPDSGAAPSSTVYVIPYGGYPYGSYATYCYSPFLFSSYGWYGGFHPWYSRGFHTWHGGVPRAGFGFSHAGSFSRQMPSSRGSFSFGGQSHARR